MKLTTKVYSSTLAFMWLLELCLGKGNSFYPYFSATTSVISTSTGKVRGIPLKVFENDVTAFLGIPFAEPPTGENRFRKPLPVQPWHGVYDAIADPPPCMQYNAKDYAWIPKSRTSEDCLYLNVWVPGKCMSQGDISLTSGKPVMIWIHGGGYFSGSSSIDIYDGTTLAAYGNVIVVSMNYRVGLFGFLSSGSEDAPGNFGLHDQLLAMKWVKDNIKQFGGNPDSITLFGESAGAISVAYHLISPMSKGLFNRGIMQSGSPYHVILEQEPKNGVLKSNLLATSFGCADDRVNMLTKPKQVVDCLRRIPASELVKFEAAMLEKFPFSFLPIYGDDFLPQSPMMTLNSGNFKHTELLIGNNQDEGSLFLNYIMPDIFGAKVAADISKDQAKMLIFSFFQNSTYPSPQVVADFYLSNVNDGDHQGLRKAVSDMYGDYFIVCPSVFFAEKFRNNNVFYYYFTHRPSNTIWGDWTGVTHFEEVPFVFGVPIRDPRSYTAEEGRFSRSIIHKWTSFAKNGLPISYKGREVWPTFSQSNPQYFELNPRSSRIGRGPHTEACNFWRSYFTAP